MNAEEPPPRQAWWRDGTVAIVCDEDPYAVDNGASTYNRAIIDSLLRTGATARLVVTGVRPARARRAYPSGLTVRHVHARRIAGLLIPTSPSSLARRLLGRRRRRSPSVAHIGRLLSGKDIRGVSRGTAGLTVSAALIDTIFRAPALDALTGVPAILIGHDVFHQRTASFRANGLEVRPAINAASEAKILARFDAILSISEEDTREHRHLAPAALVETIYPVAAVPAATHVEGERKDPRLFYLGTMAHHNVDGLRWFLGEVWPRIRAATPDAQLEVVGSIAGAFPDPEDGVHFHGRLEDMHVVADRCAFAINPVRMGSGIKIKMVDYFALGLACVTTLQGGAGFPADDERPFLCPDGADGFAETVIALIRDPAEARQLAGSAPAYLKHFSPARADTVWAQLLDRIETRRVRAS